jgi:hydroxymethylpyrimidine pyrophosphatase-like HAD family hydrolase
MFDHKLKQDPHKQTRQHQIARIGQTGLKLLAFDLDGTLLNQSGHLSGENRKAIEEARESGMAITLVTGRHISKVRPLVEELKLNVPFVTSNGCEVWTSQGELLHRSSLAHEERRWLHRMALDNNLSYRAYCVGGVYDWRADAGEVKETSSSCYVDEEWLKVLVSDAGGVVRGAGQAGLADAAAAKAAQPRCIRGLYEQLTADPRFTLAAYSSDPAQIHRIDVHPAGVDKATGLQAVCRLLGVTAAQVAAFGDDTNDIAMLRWAQLGVAMEHAPAAVIDSANIVAPHHNRDGVAVVIRELLALRL